MPYTQVYQKSDCTAAKDISWANIAKRCNVEVPAMAVTSVNRRIAKAPKFSWPFNNRSTGNSTAFTPA